MNKRISIRPWRSHRQYQQVQHKQEYIYIVIRHFYTKKFIGFTKCRRQRNKETRITNITAVFWHDQKASCVCTRGKPRTIFQVDQRKQRSTFLASSPFLRCIQLCIHPPVQLAPFETCSPDMHPFASPASSSKTCSSFTGPEASSQLRHCQLSWWPEMWGQLT